MCCQPGLQGVSAEGGVGATALGAGLWELEIPRRSSPLTHFLLSPTNLLTFGKGESLQFACFSKFPLSPVLLPLSSAGLPRPRHGRGHWLGAEERRLIPEPIVAGQPGDTSAWWPQAMLRGGTGVPGAGLLGEPAQCPSLAAREPPDYILLTVKNLK